MVASTRTGEHPDVMLAPRSSAERRLGYFRLDSALLQRSTSLGLAQFVSTAWAGWPPACQSRPALTALFLSGGCGLEWRPPGPAAGIRNSPTGQWLQAWANADTEIRASESAWWSRAARWKPSVFDSTWRMLQELPRTNNPVPREIRRSRPQIGLTDSPMDFSPCEVG